MYSIKILDHRSLFYEGIKEIFGNRNHSDLILIADGKEHCCHRAILCAFVPKWQTIESEYFPLSKGKCLYV